VRCFRNDRLLGFDNYLGYFFLYRDYFRRFFFYRRRLHHRFRGGGIFLVFGNIDELDKDGFFGLPG
jgi:hypothetical protein